MMDAPNLQGRKRTKEVKKVVKYVLHLDENKMSQRMCLSEHPFGTLKRSLGQYYFLLKGIVKVTARDGLVLSLVQHASCHQHERRSCTRGSPQVRKGRAINSKKLLCEAQFKPSGAQKIVTNKNREENHPTSKAFIWLH